MKVTPMFLIVCLAMSFFLIGIGCNRGQQQPKPESAKQQPKPPSIQQPEPESIQKATTGMRQPLSAGQNTLALSADSEKEPLEGFLSPEDSKKWLNDNHFQVRQLWTEGNEYKSAADNVYIITCKYDDSSANRYYSSRSTISGRNGVFISGPASAKVIIDTQGQLRVAPMYVFPTSADPEKEPLEGFLPPEDSKK